MKNKHPKTLSFSEKLRYFWEKIRFKYKFTSLNEKTLEEGFSLRLSLLSGFLALMGFAVVLVTLTSIVIINTPIRNYLPGYLDMEVRNTIIDNAMKVDSLEEVMASQTRYINNMSAILRGDNTVDPIPQIDSIINRSNINLDKSEITAEFVKSYEEEEKYNLNMPDLSRSLPENLIFCRPVKGMISSHFNAEESHFGIDIATNAKESILATMKGTVIFAGYDANAGYVIQIQHSNGFVSVYKHNALLLKEQGNEVNVGEAIALAGNTGILSSGTHLHFELWYKGNPINPEEFVVF